MVSRAVLMNNIIFRVLPLTYAIILVRSLKSPGLDLEHLQQLKSPS